MEEQQKDQILRFLKLVGRKQDNPIVKKSSQTGMRCVQNTLDPAIIELSDEKCVE